MRALTVRQPWAWAIIHGGKDVENRTRNVAGSYRGPVAIHAGKVTDDDAFDDPAIRDGLERSGFATILRDAGGASGAFVGVVDLVDVHQVPDCVDEDGAMCSAWAQPGRLWRGECLWHLVLANPRPLAEPVPCRGALGLWTPPADVLERLEAAL